MSRQDYQAIARAIHATFGTKGNLDDLIQHLGTHGDLCRTRVAESIADALAADNPRFDRARFIEACETGSCKGMRR